MRLIWCAWVILLFGVSFAFSFDSKEHVLVTVDKVKVRAWEPITIKVYVKAVIDEDICYSGNSEEKGVFGSLFIVNPKGEIVDRFNVMPALNPLLTNARIYSMGQPPRTAYYLRLLKGDEICLSTYNWIPKSPGTYTIFWKEGRWNYYDFDKTSAIKTFTVEVTGFSRTMGIEK